MSGQLNIFYFGLHTFYIFSVPLVLHEHGNMTWHLAFLTWLLAFLSSHNPYCMQAKTIFQFLLDCSSPHVSTSA